MTSDYPQTREELQASIAREWDKSYADLDEVQKRLVDRKVENILKPRTPTRGQTKSYLGDGVYVEVQHGGLMLTTENGIWVTNRVFLEPEVYSGLVNYVARLKEPR